MKKKLLAVALCCGLLMTACGSEPTADSTISTDSQTGTDLNADEQTDNQETIDESSSTDDSDSEPVEEEHVPAEIALLLPTKYIMTYEGEQGTIEEISYMAQDYLGDGEPYEKRAFVYLPAGYDETKQYNVVYLMHGIGGSENEWGFNDKYNSKLKKILDRLMGDGDVEPFIVVTPNGKALALSNIDGNDLFYNYAYELRNDLIPYIDGHYATYADYSEDGYDLTAARTHRAMAGLSMGGMQTINIGICECLDIFSWFGAFSAAPTSYESTVVGQYIDNSEYTVDYFYNICGLDDSIAYWSAAAAARNLPDVCENITEAENFTWHEKSGGHDFNIWYLGMYNFAQIAFNEDASAASVFAED